VKAGIRIKSLIFTFAIPNKDLIITKERLPLYGNYALGNAYTVQDNTVSFFSI